MTAMVHCKSNKSPVVLPILLYQLEEGFKRRRIMAKLIQRLITLGTVAVHKAVVIAVIYRDKIVLVLFYKLLSLGIDLGYCGIYVIVHISFKIYLRHTVSRCGHYAGLFPASYQRVKQSIYGYYRLNVCLDSMHVGRSARIHCTKANRRYRGHDRTEGYLKLAPFGYGEQQIRILFVYPRSYRVGVIHKYSVNSRAACFALYILQKHTVCAL